MDCRSFRNMRQAWIVNANIYTCTLIYRLIDHRGVFSSFRNMRQAWMLVYIRVHLYIDLSPQCFIFECDYSNTCVVMCILISINVI